VADLIAKSACAGLLPLEIGTLNLIEVVAQHVTVLAPYKDQHKAVSYELKKHHGMALPGVNRALGKETSRVLWFSQGQWAVIGPKPTSELAKLGAVVDQSDAWAIVRLEGPDAEAVLARLVRSSLYHMMASITRVGDNSFQVMVFRSMAETLVHDLRVAMQKVAARQG
jgi:sarcosine oxidase gamma subunit